jgi:hypothetical protein
MNAEYREVLQTIAPGYADGLFNIFYRMEPPTMAAEAGIEIEFIRKRNVRKEDRGKETAARRGEHPGLVCILPAMEPCSTYKPGIPSDRSSSLGCKPWHDKQTGQTFLKPGDGKYPHFYFHFIDEELGLAVYLTRFGKQVIATTGIKLRELVLIPQLNIAHAA